MSDVNFLLCQFEGLYSFLSDDDGDDDDDHVDGGSEGINDHYGDDGSGVSGDNNGTGGDDD